MPQPPLGLKHNIAIKAANAADGKCMPFPAIRRIADADAPSRLLASSDMRIEMMQQYKHAPCTAAAFKDV